MIESATLPAAERTEREIERLRRLSRARPDDPELLLHLASLLLADGRTEEAASEFRDLLTRNADSRVWEAAGTALVRAEQYELAREFLKRAATDRPAARLDLAIALFFTDGPAEALKVIEKPPEGAQVGDYLLMKARFLDAARQSAEAQKALQEGLRYSTSNPHVAQQAALLLLRYDRKAEALDTLTRAMKSAPDNPDLLLTKAIVLGLLDQNSAAERALQEIQTRWPEWDRPYLVHGLVLERAGKREEARQKLRTAQALGSRDLSVNCALARLAAAPAPDAQCACLTGLRQLLFPGCDKP